MHVINSAVIMYINYLPHAYTEIYWQEQSSLNYSKADCKAYTQFRFAFYSNCHQGLMALRIFNTIL